MNLIKEHEFVPTPGKEYDATAYPHDGIFYNPYTNTTYFRYSSPGPVVLSAFGFRFQPHKTEDSQETTLSVNDLATILAVAIHRDAAVEQVKK